MYAFSGVLAALVRRGTTGRGGPVEVSMLEALAEWMGHPLHHALHGGEPPARTGLAHAVIAPYDAYPTGDGGRVLLSVQNDREWRRLAEQVIGRPELGTDPAYATNAARVANRAETDELVAGALGVLDADEALARLEKAGIACARLRDLPELAAHPQLAARERWREVGSPVGPLRALLPPITLPGGDEARMGDVPALGQHTETLLHAVGMTDDEIAAMRGEGVVACARAPEGCWGNAGSLGVRAGTRTECAQCPPNSERRSRRRGANRETRLTRLPRSLRWCAVSRAVSSRISEVASTVSRCGMAGPASTDRWRSSRELVALLPHVIAGTLALLRTVICSMSLPTRTSPPGPGRVTLSPQWGTRVSRPQDSPSL
jgi:hypothetical protein